MQITAEPGFVVPDLTISHYTACGHIETSLLRNYVIPKEVSNSIANSSQTIYSECPSEWSDCQFAGDTIRVLSSSEGV